VSATRTANAVSIQLQPDTVQMLPIGALTYSEFNARKSFDVAELAELAASIRQHGVRIPLLVRPVGSEYEIVAGHRRRMAADLEKLTELPCIVREMSDDEAREIMVIENLQRADLPPLEEADAYDGLMPSLGSVANVAARVGKPIEYVTRRLKLRALTALSRRALAEKLITIDHALLLSKLAAKEQDDILKWTLDVNAGVKTSCEKVLEDALGRRKRREDGVHYGYWEPQSVLDLKHHIEATTDLALSKAPWDLKDVELVPSAGACVDCAKNTAHNTALFGDLIVEQACCTDSACFNTKRDAFVRIQLDKAGQGAVRLSWRDSSAKPKWAKDGSGPDLGQVFKEGAWGEAKKGSCPNVVAGVTVDYPRYEYGDERKKKPGKILTVCVAEKCKAHPKAWERPKHSSHAGYDPKAEAEKQKKQEAASAAENKIRLDLAKRAIAGVTKLPDEAWRVLALRAAGYEDGKQLLGSSAKAAFKTAAIDSAEFAKAVAAVVLKTSALEIWRLADPKDQRGVFLEALKLFGVDGSSAWLRPKPTKVVPNAATPRGGRGVSPEPSKGASNQARPAKKKTAKKRILSNEARKRITAAIKKRWAERQKGGAE
jgi:ParB/RepB/Spo0J family partition protein